MLGVPTTVLELLMLPVTVGEEVPVLLTDILFDTVPEDDLDLEACPEFVPELLTVEVLDADDDIVSVLLIVLQGVFVFEAVEENVLNEVLVTD